jgi:hypothetical protein
VTVFALIDWTRSGDDIADWTFQVEFQIFGQLDVHRSAHRRHREVFLFGPLLLTGEIQFANLYLEMKQSKIPLLQGTKLKEQE